MTSSNDRISSRGAARWLPVLAGALVPLFAASAAFAEEAAAPVVTIDTGDTAWVIAASALVLMMTLPGLALFYGGLVRSRNVLNVFMQCFLAAGVVGVLWVLRGLQPRLRHRRRLHRRSLEARPRERQLRTRRSPTSRRRRGRFRS